MARYKDNKQSVLDNKQSHYSERLIIFFTILGIFVLGLFVWWADQMFKGGMIALGIILFSIIVIGIAFAVLKLNNSGEDRGFKMLQTASMLYMQHAVNNADVESYREKARIATARLEREQLKHERQQQNQKLLPVNQELETEWKVVNDTNARLTIIE